MADGKSHTHEHDGGGASPHNHGGHGGQTAAIDGHSHVTGHHHDGTADAGAAVPVGYRDHVDGHDRVPGAGCCGTFCHAAFFLTASAYVPVHPARPTFVRSNGRRLVAVDPDQLQRPPSRLLSL
jgi:hypothetical protein